MGPRPRPLTSSVVLSRIQETCQDLLVANHGRRVLSVTSEWSRVQGQGLAGLALLQVLGSVQNRGQQVFVDLGLLWNQSDIDRAVKRIQHFPSRP